LKCYELQGPSGINGSTLVDKPVAQPSERQVLVRLKRRSTQPRSRYYSAQLFIDADATSAMFKQQLNALPAEQRAAMMASKDEYIAFYSRAKDVHLAVSRETGRLLYMLARATNARAMIEFGTSFGISTLHLAAALRDNGGGKLITTEFEATKIARARANIAASGLADLLKSVKAMRWKRWRKACLNRSILYCWMALRGFIQTSCRWSRSDYAWAR
jgi:hypothetical protein